MITNTEGSVMGLSFWQIALVATLFLLLFGRGKIPQLMGDLAEGIKSFKKGVSDMNTESSEPVKQVEEKAASESKV